MSIHLSIQADDSEVEELLTFIRTHFSSLTLWEQREITVRALKWMNAAHECFFSVEIATVRLLDHDPADLVS
jgi:hypothetical protein